MFQIFLTQSTPCWHIFYRFRRGISVLTPESHASKLVFADSSEDYFLTPTRKNHLRVLKISLRVFLVTTMPKIENEPITSPLDDESTIFKQIFFLHARKKVMPFKRDEVAKMHKPDFRNTRCPTYSLRSRIISQELFLRTATLPERTPKLRTPKVVIWKHDDSFDDF